MLNTPLKLCISFLAIIGVAKVNAQEAATATGGDGLGSGGSVAYSIGQVVYATNVDASGSTAQGVQQPYANIVTGINDLDLGITLSVFPNPSTTQLTLSISDYSNRRISYQLVDIKGKILESKIVLSNQTQINTGGLPGAVYFLNIFQKGRKIHTFKVVKK